MFVLQSTVQYNVVYNVHVSMCICMHTHNDLDTKIHQLIYFTPVNNLYYTVSREGYEGIRLTR